MESRIYKNLKFMTNKYRGKVLEVPALLGRKNFIL